MIGNDTVQMPREYGMDKVPQLTWGQLALFVLLPIIWWIVVLYIFVPLLLPYYSTADGELTG